MDIKVVTEGVISLFLIMFVGIYASKRDIITEHINKGLTEIMLKITLPLMVISSFVFTYDDSIKDNVMKSFYYSFTVFIVVGIIAYLFLKPVKGKKRDVLQFAMVFSNCGYVGFPVINSIYGAEGVIYTSVFNMFFSIFLWTYGVMVFTGNISMKDVKKVLLNPCVIAVYIGVIIMIFNIKVPQVILSPIKSVGGMTSPLSMIIIGYILSKVKVKEYLKDWTIYYGSIIKLVIIPMVLFGVAKIMGDSSKVANTMIILSAMPAAAMTSILADKFDKEREYASIIVFITTLASLLTFPIVLKIIS